MPSIFANIKRTFYPGTGRRIFDDRFNLVFGKLEKAR